VARRYFEAIASRGLGEYLEMPVKPTDAEVHAWHLFPVRLMDGGAERRGLVIDRLREAGIGTSVHFIPLHLHPYYRRMYGYTREDLPVSTREYEREISLPIYPDLGDEEVDRVVEAIGAALSS